MRYYEVEWKTIAGQGTLLFKSEHKRGTRRNREDAIHALYSNFGYTGTQFLEILSIKLCKR